MYDDEVMILDEKVNYIDTAENLWKVIAMTIEEILSKEENQTFDRKSINISPIRLLKLEQKKFRVSMKREERIMCL